MRARERCRWLLVALVAAAAVWFWVSGRPATRRSEPIPRVAPPGVGMQGVRAARGASTHRIPPLPDAAENGGSLRGTEVDGALPIDAGGHLIAAPDVVRLFDYFFLTSGEMSDAAIRRRIESEIAERLVEPARSEALALLERYMRYRTEAAQLYERKGDDTSPAARIAAIAELRREIFGEDAEALFGQDLGYAVVAAEMQQVALDPRLTPDERDQRLAELEESLPEEVRAARASAMAPRDLARDEAELRASGGSDEEIRALRVERFGADAADRLGDLDRRRAEWRERVDDFRRRRSVIQDDNTLTTKDRAAKIDDLLNDSFDSMERQRISALDRIELGR